MKMGENSRLRVVSAVMWFLLAAAKNREQMNRV